MSGRCWAAQPAYYLLANTWHPTSQKTHMEDSAMRTAQVARMTTNLRAGSRTRACRGFQPPRIGHHRRSRTIISLGGNDMLWTILVVVLIVLVVLALVGRGRFSR